MQTVGYSNNDKDYSKLFTYITAATNYICILKT